MTRISKHTLTPAAHKELLDQFVALFAGQSEKYVRDVFLGLLSPTEEIMLIKRLAILIMLQQRYSTYAISQTLQVSDQTVRSAQSKIADGSYDPLLKLLRKPDFNKAEWIELIGKIVSLGMPAYGSNRGLGFKK